MTTAEITTMQEEIRELAETRDAVILAHNYQVPEIQDVADYVGDSLGLSREAAATDADTIVFCGVHFMAETAAILSPQKTVLIPDLDAGCSLAASISADQLRAWKAENPGAVVVSYVNTTAEVKAEREGRHRVDPRGHRDPVPPGHVPRALAREGHGSQAADLDG
jgi:quinolinate synthase